MTAPHEATIVHEIEGPSNRSFGVTVGGILIVIAMVRWALKGSMSTLMLVFCIVGLVLIVLALIAPNRLATANKLWTKLGLLLFKVANPVIMFLIYVTTFVPIGLFRRWRGHDPLSTLIDSSASTYWIDRERGAELSMLNQF